MVNVLFQITYFMGLYKVQDSLMLRSLKHLKNWQFGGYFSEGKQPKFGFVVLGICVDVCLTIGTDKGITKVNEDLKGHTFWIDDLTNHALDIRALECKNM